MIAMHEPTTRLTDEQVAHFHANGYLALDAVTSAEEVAWLIDICDRLFAEKAGFDEGNQYDLAGTDGKDEPPGLPQLVHPVNYAPELGGMLLKVNWKEELEYDSLGIWVPLQEATLENGCMQFIPASHKGEVLPHHPIGHDPRVPTAQ